jgi:PAS domain S-box-containing protein
MESSIPSLAPAKRAPEFALEILDSLPDLVSYVEPDRRYRFLNQAYNAWFGIDPSRAVGRPLPEVMGEAVYAFARPYFDKAFAGEPTVFTALAPLKYGPPREIEARLIPDHGEEGEVRGLFAIVRDVSERERWRREMLSVLDGMDACFLALDPEGRMTFTNAATRRFLAASGLEEYANEASVLGRRMWDISPDLRGGELQRAFERVRASGEPEAFEYSSVLRPDRIMDLRVFPTSSGAVGVSAIDVTERRRAEEELRKEEERLRISLAAARMAAFEYDTRSGETRCSGDMEGVLGQKPTAAGLEDQVHPDDRELVLAARKQSLESGEPCDVTVRCPGPRPGEWLWINLQSTRIVDACGRIRVVGVVRDVTRAHVADQMLRAANIDLQAQVQSEAAERFQAVLERERFWTLSRDLHAVVTRDGSTLRRINAAAWKAALGYDADQLLGRSIRDFIHPDDLEATRVKVARLNTAEMVEFEYRIRHADGGWRWTSWKLISDGELNYASGRDLTEEKAREEQIRRSQKLEALGQLTGGVAHDFNNLLTAIMGALDLVERHPDDGALRKQLISSALIAARRGEQLNKQLLSFARRQASHREFVTPSSRLQEMQPLIRGALSERIGLELDAAPKAKGAMVDPAQFEVAVLNLVVNARDAMPHGGSLRIRVREASAKEIRRLALPGGSHLVLEVADTGTGMAPEVLAHAFEPFFTTKEVGRGSGLGLAQVYSFARQSGGAADIETEQGRGTVVSLYLPASDPPPAAEEPDAGEACTPARRRILLVEDDALVGAVTESMLTDMGHLVTRAEDAQGAREALSSAEFDLLFTDVRMPGDCNGVQLAHEATALRPELRVLLCSGWTDDELAEEADGARWPLLAKPFDVVGLGRAVKGALAV